MSLSRDDAWRLLGSYTKSQSLLRHAMAVEAAMRTYARKFGGDEEKWGIVGLLQNFDYEQNPDPEDHPFVGARILKEEGYPEEIIYAIKSHAEYLNLPRQSPMDKTLFAVDELCGFLTAAALVRPGKRIAEFQSSPSRRK